MDVEGNEKVDEPAQVSAAGEPVTIGCLISFSAFQYCFKAVKQRGTPKVLEFFQRMSYQ